MFFDVGTFNEIKKQFAAQKRKNSFTSALFCHALSFFAMHPVLSQSDTLHSIIAVLEYKVPIAVLQISTVNNVY